MKKLFCILINLILCLSYLNAQIVTTLPAFPTEDDEVTVIFDASLGTAGLSGHTGDMYAHTGVITDISGGNWKYAPSWSVNQAKYKMTSLGNDKWQLTITPSMRSYYGVPAGEKILQMAFVFRNSTGTKEGKDTGGKDIFVKVYESGLTVRLEQPTSTTFLKGESVQLKAVASISSNIKLFVDDSQIASTNGVTELSTSYTFNKIGNVTLKAVATINDVTTEDVMTINVLDETTQETKPRSARPGINYVNDNEATLVLQAPGKKNVYVIGDFNDWTYSTNYQMKQDGEYFWLTLKGLEKGKEYAFQYVVDQEITIADPYTEKVLDPWNDSYISESVYPGLKKYPTGKAEGIVSVLQTGQTPYQWKTTNFVKPDKEQLMIYELLIRDFTVSHTYKGAMEMLYYLKALGINAIHLMPVNEFEGNSSWGYNPSFYFAPDKYYGTKDDLKAFVDECHANGIAVIMDLVLNHSFGQSPFYQLYRDSDGRPSANNPWYNQESNIANTDLQWGYDFNHESTYTKALVDSVASFWINEYKVDGFRYDFTKGFSNTKHTGWANDYDAARIANLRRMANEVWKRDSKSYIIFEHLTSGTTEEKELGESGIMLWRNSNYAYCQSAMGFSAGSGFTGLYAANQNMPAGSLIGYMESHDEERTSYKAKTYGNGIIKTSLDSRMSQAAANAAFFFTVPGPKLIWQFGELGYDISIDYNGRTGEKPIYWNYYDVASRRKLYNTYSELMALRKSYPELFSSSTTFSWRATEAYWNTGRTISAYNGDKAFVVVGNFTDSDRNLSTTFPKTGTWYEYKNEDNALTIASTTQANSIPVSANSYKLYTNFRPTTTGIEDEVMQNMQVVFYNPTTDELIIEGDASLVEVYAANGMLARQDTDCNTVSLSTLLPGIYVARVTLEDGRVQTCKIVR